MFYLCRGSETCDHRAQEEGSRDQKLCDPSCCSLRRCTRRESACPAPRGTRRPWHGRDSSRPPPGPPSSSPPAACCTSSAIATLAPGLDPPAFSCSSRPGPAVPRARASSAGLGVSIPRPSAGTSRSSHGPGTYSAGVHRGHTVQFVATDSGGAHATKSGRRRELRSSRRWPTRGPDNLRQLVRLGGSARLTASTRSSPPRPGDGRSRRRPPRSCPRTRDNPATPRTPSPRVPARRSISTKPAGSPAAPAPR